MPLASNGHTQKATALLGLGRFNEAREALEKGKTTTTTNPAYIDEALKKLDEGMKIIDQYEKDNGPLP